MYCDKVIEWKMQSIILNFEFWNSWQYEVTGKDQISKCRGFDVIMDNINHFLGIATFLAVR